MAGGMSVADIISEDIVFEVSHSILQVSKTISSVIIIVLQYIFFIRNAVNLRMLPCIIILSFCFNIKITIITTNLNASPKQSRVMLCRIGFASAFNVSCIPKNFYAHSTRKAKGDSSQGQK